MKDKIKLSPKLLLIAGMACSFLSSMAFTTSLFGRTEKSIRAFYIVASLQFWLFLIAEIVLLLLAKRMVKTTTANADLPYINRIKKIIIISFILILIFFIGALLGSKGVVSGVVIVALSMTLFLFQMVCVSNSKLFKNIMNSERKQKDE